MTYMLILLQHNLPFDLVSKESGIEHGFSLGKENMIT